MANFPVHLTSSALIGAAYGTAAHVGYGVPLPTALLAGGLCTIAGVLPDVDSDNAIILREILAFCAAVIPMLLLDRFREMQWTQETVIVVSGLLYVIIRFGVGELIRRTTVHRGMWHSIPAAANISLLIYFLCACPDMQMRLFKTSAVAIGYVWHLILDEVYAVERMGGRVRVKRSFGSALKLWGDRSFPNLITYGFSAALVALLVMNPLALRYVDPYGHQHAHGQTPVGSQYPQQQMTPLPQSRPPYPDSGYPPSNPGYAPGYQPAQPEYYPPPAAPSNPARGRW